MKCAAAVAFVAVIVHLIARPGQRDGHRRARIDCAPPRRGHLAAVAPHVAAPVAYVSGTLGTLIGADLSELGGGMASIGGAGTFDGVCLSGIVAVILVGTAR